jgi:hypothetical protein
MPHMQQCLSYRRGARNVSRAPFASHAHSRWVENGGDPHGPTKAEASA